LRVLTGYVEWALDRDRQPRNDDPNKLCEKEKNGLMVLRWAAKIPEDVYR
jgi:hypothetical protein